MQGFNTYLKDLFDQNFSISFDTYLKDKEMRNRIELTNVDVDFFMNLFLEKNHCKNQNL